MMRIMPSSATMDDILLIVNPRAGRGRGRTTGALVERLLAGRGAPFRAVSTRGPGMVGGILAEEGPRSVICVGGDGTIHEAVNALAGGARSLGIVPAGSGNDFARSLGIPFDPASAVEDILGGATQTIDLGRVRVGNLDGMASEPRYFANSLGIGFDAEVASAIRRIPALRGLALYAAAVILTAVHYRAREFRVCLDGVWSTGKLLLVAVGNGQGAGGGFRLTPRAELADGLLDVCMVREISPAGILFLAPRVIRGRHGESPKTVLSRFARMELETDTPVGVHADGEILTLGATAVEAEVVPGILKVLGGTGRRTP
ncbi:MAG: diacylglycerol kinase family protein [Bacteroidota bacterium]